MGFSGDLLVLFYSLGRYAFYHLSRCISKYLFECVELKVSYYQKETPSSGRYSHCHPWMLWEFEMSYFELYMILWASQAINVKKKYKKRYP